MAAAQTYEPLGTTTLVGTAVTIDFTSISGSYTDLILVISGASSSGNNIFTRFNSNTATNYSATRLSGSGTSALSDRESSATWIVSTNYGWPTTAAGEQNTIMQINNYSNSTTYKTVLIRSNRASNGVDAIVGLWRQTSAITSISLSTNGFSGAAGWAAGTTATLYGIKAA